MSVSDPTLPKEKPLPQSPASRADDMLVKERQQEQASRLGSRL